MSTEQTIARNIEALLTAATERYGDKAPEALMTLMAQDIAARRAGR